MGKLSEVFVEYSRSTTGTAAVAVLKIILKILKKYDGMIRLTM